MKINSNDELRELFEEEAKEEILCKVESEMSGKTARLSDFILNSANDFWKMNFIIECVINNAINFDDDFVLKILKMSKTNEKINHLKVICDYIDFDANNNIKIQDQLVDNLQYKIMKKS